MDVFAKNHLKSRMKRGLIYFLLLQNSYLLIVRFVSYEFYTLNIFNRQILSIFTLLSSDLA